MIFLLQISQKFLSEIAPPMQAFSGKPPREKPQNAAADHKMSRQFATNVTTIYDIFCPVPFLPSPFFWISPAQINGPFYYRECLDARFPRMPQWAVSSLLKRRHPINLRKIRAPMRQKSVRNASEMRQKCAKMGLVLLGKKRNVPKCVKNES